MTMHIYIEPDVSETRAIYNLITLHVDDEGNESTEVTPYATLQQAQDAAEDKYKGVVDG